MKILKIVLGLVAALLVIFLALGMITPSIEFSNEVEVDKPLQEAWAVYMDESKLTEWLPSIESIELQSGNQNEVGSTYLIKIDHEGQKMEMTEEITALKENELMSMKFSGQGFDQTLDMNFSEKDGKTIISSSGNMTGKGMFMRSIFALNKSAMAKQDLEVLNNLKGVIESNTTDYFPEPEMEAAVMSEDGAVEATEEAADESIQ